MKRATLVWKGKDLRSDVVEVTVFPKPPVKHKVLMKSFQTWLHSKSATPEAVERKRLVRQILGESTPLTSRSCAAFSQNARILHAWPSLPIYAGMEGSPTG